MALRHEQPRRGGAGSWTSARRTSPSPTPRSPPVRRRAGTPRASPAPGPTRSPSSPAAGGEPRPAPGPVRWAAPGGLRSCVEDLAAGLDVTSGTRSSRWTRRPGWARRRRGRRRAGRRRRARDAAAAGVGPAPGADWPLGSGLEDGARWSPTLHGLGRLDRPWWPELDGAFVDGSEVIDRIADDGRRRGDGAACSSCTARPAYAERWLDDPEGGIEGVLAELARPAGRRRHRACSRARVRAARGAGRSPRPSPPTRARSRSTSDLPVGVCGDGWGPQVARRAGLALGRPALRRGSRRASLRLIAQSCPAPAALPWRVGSTTSRRPSRSVACPRSCSSAPSGATRARARRPTCSASAVDYVVRYQGGNNAGHTVVAGRREVRAAPAARRASSRPAACPVIGNGVVVDLGVLFEEIDALTARGVDTLAAAGPRRRARDHAVPPDASTRSPSGSSASAGSAPPAAASARPTPTRSPGSASGSQDLLRRDDPARRSSRPRSTARTRSWSRSTTGGPSTVDEVVEDLARVRRAAAARWSPTPALAAQPGARRAARPCCFEGGQATHARRRPRHLPVRHVVERRRPAARAPARASPPTRIDRVIARRSRRTRPGSGEGPFPTELLDEDGERLRKAGGEYGTTTGRPRRCGWFDAVVARYAARVNGRHRPRPHQARRAVRPREGAGLRRPTTSTASGTTRCR